MSDFRLELYSRYRSTFKVMNSQLSDNVLSSYRSWCEYNWCEYRYLPLLDGLKSNDRILELGCGSGNMLEFFRKNGFTNAEGIDISEEQISIAVKRGLNAKVADVFDYLDLIENRFSVIIAIDFVEHFTKEELMKKLIPSIYKAFKKGGRLIIQTPNGQGVFPRQIIYGDLTHLTIFTPNSLQQILNFFGFDDFKFLETGPAPKNFKGKVRVILWGLLKSIANIIRRIETEKSQDIWTENMICYCRKP